MTKNQKNFIRTARVAHLATADANGQPLVIPICFAFDRGKFFSAVDEKPKQNLPQKLKRVRNIRENPHVSLVIDRYSENWRRLAYVLVAGKAKILQTGEKHRKAVRLLRKKYPQYRRMAIHDRPIIAITSLRTKSWGNF